MPIIDPLERRDTARLVGLAGELRGRQVEGVRYAGLAEDEPWEEEGQRPGVHHVEMAVELTVGGEVLTVTWATRKSVQGLACHLGATAAAEEFLGDDVSFTDVSGAEAWSGLVGATVDDVAASWHRADFADADSVCSLRLRLGGADVVISLGRCVDRVVSYQPDSLLVIFDERLARSDTPGAGMPPLWGTSMLRGSGETG